MDMPIQPRLVVRYDQAPWDRGHILALYLIDPLHLREDSKWHELSSNEDIAFYRVYNHKYFQFVSSKSHNHLVNAILAMEPVDTEDDAEWWIWQVEAPGWEGLWLTSILAVTPGPFEYQAEIDAWLRPYGLALLPQGDYVRGLARLEEISSAKMKTAMEQLVWLENVLIELNRRIMRVGQRFWRTIQQASMPLPSEDPIEALAAPYRRQGRKSRQPIETKGDVLLQGFGM
jgi:hypothetical protein